jgi:hypothetical protein
MLCFDCAQRIASKSWPLVGEDGGTGVPDIPEMVKDICPVCEGDEGSDEEEEVDGD